MLGLGLTLVLQVYVGALSDYSASIDDNVDTVYDTIIASEQMHNLDEDRSRVDISHIGSEREYDCHIDEIDDIDDDYLSYRVQVDDSIGNPPLNCQGSFTANIQMYETRILVKNGEELIPSKLEVAEN